MLDNSHSFGNLEDVMYITLLRKTRRHMYTIERIYVYKETKNKNKLNKVFVQYRKIVLHVSKSTVPTTSSLIVIGKKTHKKA